MGKIIDINGMKFNRWTVKKYDKIKNGMATWICECECGTIKSIAGNELRGNRSKSCGCYQIEKLIELSTTHGMSHSPTWISHNSMKERCSKEYDKEYPNYGGRGIKVCDRWLGKDGLLNFVEDMGLRPKGMTLDRKDVDGDYCKDNCKWSTPVEQSNNRRNNVYLTFMGKTQTIPQWSKELGITCSAIYQRRYKGLSIEEILHTPHKGA